MKTMNFIIRIMMVAMVMHCLSFTTNAETTSEGKITLESFEILPNETKRLSIKMEHNFDVCAMQFNMYLPKGMEILKDENGKYNIAISSNRDYTEENLGFSCQSGLKKDGSLIFVCYNANGTDYPMLGNSGDAVLEFTVKTNGEFAGGNIELKKVVLTDAIESQMEETVRNEQTGEDETQLVAKVQSVSINCPDVVAEVSITKPKPEEGYEFGIDNVETWHNRQMEYAISLTHKVDISAFQFDLYLPEGITVPKNENGEFIATLNPERATSSHVITSIEQADGAIRFMCYSNQSLNLNGESGGVVLILPLNISVGMEGVYGVEVKEILLSEANATGHKCEDVSASITVKPYIKGDSNADGTVNVVDVVNTVNAALGVISDSFVEEAGDVNSDGNINVLDVVATMNLVLNITTQTTLDVSLLSNNVVKEAEENIVSEKVFIEDFTMYATESKTIDVNLTNVNTYSAVQFDLYLPDGLNVDCDEEGTYLFEKTTRLTDYHMISSNRLGNGAIRVIVWSNPTKNIKLNEGAIMRIPFKASADMFAGEYDVEIKDVIISSFSAEGMALSNTSTTLTIEDSMTGIEDVVEDIEAEYYNLQGVKVENPEKGVYIKKQGGKTTKVVINE